MEGQPPSLRAVVPVATSGAQLLPHWISQLHRLFGKRFLDGSQFWIHWEQFNQCQFSSSWSCHERPPPSPKHTRHSARAFLRLSVVNAVNWSRANFSSERSAQPSDIVLIAGDSWSSLDERPAAPCTRVTASKQQLEDLSSAAKREERQRKRWRFPPGEVGTR